MTNTESKISIWYHTIDSMLTAQEKESLIETVELLLAERTEQCAKIAETVELPASLRSPGGIAVEAEAEAKKQCDKKNLKDHSFVPYNHHQCWLCSATPDRHSKHIDSPDRIATLQEWLATDAKIIQQLNESNNLLSEKIAQLEKEKHELIKEIVDAHEEITSGTAEPCLCSICSCFYSSTTNRKA